MMSTAVPLLDFQPPPAAAALTAFMGSLATSAAVEFPVLSAAGSIGRINGATLVDLVTGRYAALFDTFIILDCRYQYEYQGGHISGARHVDTAKQLIDLYDAHTGHADRIALVFHCEYSQLRAPQSCRYFRHYDRSQNESAWPRLTFPSVFILDGGYRQFHAEYPSYCTPHGSYVSMWHNAYTRQCKEESEKNKAEFQQKAERKRKRTTTEASTAGSGAGVAAATCENTEGGSARVGDSQKAPASPSHFLRRCASTCVLSSPLANITNKLQFSPVCAPSFPSLSPSPALKRHTSMIRSFGESRRPVPQALDFNDTAAAIRTDSSPVMERKPSFVAFVPPTFCASFTAMQQRQRETTERVETLLQRSFSMI